MYLVKYFEFLGECYTNLFVTEDEQVAKDYCEKFNKVIGKAKDFYGSVTEEAESEEEVLSDYQLVMWDKLLFFSEIQGCTYSKIEGR